MKVKITCPRCGSAEIEITAEEGNPRPMYKCKRCGHKSDLFPKFEDEK